MNPIEPTSRKPVRLWPGVSIAVLMLLMRFGLPLAMPDAALVAVLGPLVGAVLILLWWMFFSRAPWLERIGALALLIVAVFATRPLVDPSIAGGLNRMMLPIFLAVPGLAVALVVWAAATRGLAPTPRRAALVVIVALTCALFVMLRTDGLHGGLPQLSWRWTPTAEEKLLAQTADAPLPLAPAAPPAATPPVPEKTAPDAGAPTSAAVTVPGTAAAPKAGEKPLDPAPSPAAAKVAAGPAMSERAFTRVEWPGFRGPDRNGVVRGVRLATDWSASPPAAIWRKPIGPGWSSFAVAGDRLYTMEQRGEHEIVACYRASTGEPVWVHRDAARFYESNGGPGPRGTPALSDGRVYSIGGTGIVNALDAETGARIWTRNAVTDTIATVPFWGIASSPLIVGDLVVVAASGALAAYDRATGDRRWTVKSTGSSFSSPQLATIDGAVQILLLAGSGLTSVAPADGAVLWRYEWAGSPIVQPGVTSDGDIVMTMSDAMGGLGVRRLHVTRGSGAWKVEERWAANTLKPFFNDYVVHNGHAYGFDGNIIACVDLADGKRKWKGGRYGNGQVLLLADQDLLLVITEEGELALVKASPDQFTEVAARVPAIEGKTWNHPVLIGDTLFIRNGQEMAAVRLARQ